MRKLIVANAILEAIFFIQLFFNKTISKHNENKAFVKVITLGSHNLPFPLPAV
jgi:hypothetical protein